MSTKQIAMKNKQNPSAKQPNRKTYSIPVLIVSAVILLITFCAATIGIVSASRVREADPATISEAQRQADAMVPVQKPELKETIETALIDNQTNTPAVDLNLRNPFAENVGGSNRNGPVSVIPVKPTTPILPNSSNATRLQPGVKNLTVRAKNNDTTVANKIPERPAVPTLPSLESRYQSWERQLAEAKTQKLPEPNVAQIYAVAEVIPTGFLESGSRKLVNFEVSQPNSEISADASFSLELGERLFDATISEVTDDGVHYLFEDGRQAFMRFAIVREGKSRQIQPLQITPAPTPIPNNLNRGLGKNKVIPVKEERAGRQNRVAANAPAADTKKSANLENLLAFVENKSKKYGGENVLRAKPTDEDYFHRVNFIAGDYSKIATPKKQVSSPCDENFVGETIRYTSAANLTLNEFLRDLQKLYSVSFIVDKDVPNDEVVLKVLDKPWNYVLEAILRSKNLEARCLTGGIISIEPKGKQAKVEQENQKSEPLILRRYTLRYIPLNSSSSAQVAGQVGGNGGGNGGAQGIESQINNLLQRGGDSRSSVSRVPNSNIIAVYATAVQHKEINNFLTEIDKPGFQVIIETNFYTVQNSKLSDLGGQMSVILGNAAGTNIGGVTNLPPAGGGDGENSGGLQPGNVSGLPSGFGTSNNSLRANANTLFGASFTVGTATFQALFSAAEQKGLANSQARSTQAVLDGGTTEVKNGDTIIIPTTGSVGGSLVNSGAITINATQSAVMQPQVVVDEAGNPIAVTLNLQLTNNSINRAYLGTATPVVATQSQSGTLRIPLNETFVIGGFFTDSVINNRTRTPGLSKVPILGELFKKRFDQIDRNRLYFAISVKVIRDVDLPKVPAPSDIDTSPVTPPAAQKPAVPKNQ